VSGPFLRSFLYEQQQHTIVDIIIAIKNTTITKIKPPFQACPSNCRRRPNKS